MYRADRHDYHHGHDHRDILQIDFYSYRNRHEYHSYAWLLLISFLCAGGEFFIALFLACSVSAQADAMHAMTHLFLYGLAFLVSRHIYTSRMDEHNAYHYREKFILLYVLLVFLGLAWILYTSVIKLISPVFVISNLMLLSVLIGLCGNIIALWILRTVSHMHRGARYKSTAHQWISLDAWGDFAFSVVVLATSLIAIFVPRFPIHIIDPLISLGAAFWIGGSGIQLLKKKML